MNDAEAKVVVALIGATVIGRAYDDVFSGPFKQIREIATDGLKWIRGHVKKVLDAVPPERQVQAAPEIAGPILRELQFIEPDSVIGDLYVNLLRRAIDRDRRDEAHPAYIKIIGQLSPDETLILEELRVKGGFPIEPTGPVGFDPVPGLPTATLNMLVSHLDSLGLVEMVGRYTGDPVHASEIRLSLTAFGTAFLKTCHENTG